MSIDRVTKVTTGPRAVYSSASTSGEAAPIAIVSAAASCDGTTAQDSGEISSDVENDEEYVTEKLLTPHRTEMGMHYRVRWYDYDPSKHTTEQAEWLPQLFIDRYWQEAQMQRTDSNGPQRQGDRSQSYQ